MSAYHFSLKQKRERPAGSPPPVGFASFYRTITELSIRHFKCPVNTPKHSLSYQLKIILCYFSPNYHSFLSAFKMDFSAVLINHPYQKINAPLKFNILLHKLLPLLFDLSLFYRTCRKTTLNRNPKE